MLHQLHNAFFDAVTFLNNEELPKDTVMKMHICTNDIIWRGDGPLALVAYTFICSLYEHIASLHFLNVTAVAKQLAGGSISHVTQHTSSS